MGAKTWMLVYSDGDPRDTLVRRPPLNRDASARLARSLFRPSRLISLNDVDLGDTQPRDGNIHIGCFDDVAVIACEEIAIDYPSQLPGRWLDRGPRVVTLHCMHSVVDWFAFAQWREGVLTRSLSVSNDHGEIENIGKPFAFEVPYWAGDYPMEVWPDDDGENMLPFHPLDLGEAALLALFGYQLEGDGSAPLDWSELPLLAFSRRKSFLQRLLRR